MKQLILCIMIINLTGCLVTPGDASDFTYVPWIQLFQKVDSTGWTNIRERKEALYNCGVDRKENLDDKNWGLNVMQRNQTLRMSSFMPEKVTSLNGLKVTSEYSSYKLSAHNVYYVK